MKTLKMAVLAAALLLASVCQATTYQETLGRAPVAVMTSQGVLVSWRALTSDPSGITFTVSKNGTAVATSSTLTTVLDANGAAGDQYTITSSTGETFTTKAWDNMYRTFDVPRPPSSKNGNTTGRYRPDDASVGDVDGDGTYELILKWMPDNARDNGTDGYSSPCILDCYKLNFETQVATQLWRINLGQNIRSGNHYSPFVVYDLDGDGRAELLCKTGPGSKDGQGNYVTAAATDATILAVDNTQNLVNSKGRILTGEEFLTVFNGQTGAAMHTIWYNPNRAFTTGNTNMAYGSWGDATGNRGERYNACVAYLDGTSALPTAIFQRGYYTRQYMWAVDWNGTTLSTRWLHRGTSASAWDCVNAAGTVTSSGTGKSSYGQGVHSLSVGDVDNDGKDEICIGSATIDDNGALLCSTGKGHGDALHLGHLVSGRTGMQVMMPHEESPYGYDVHDAATGELLASATGSEDNGRGLACDFIPSHAGWEFWSSIDSYTYSCADGSQVVQKKPDTNFRIYWTGDPYDQTFDGRYDATNGCNPRIRIWKKSGSVLTFQEFGNYGKPQTCNTTKATPVLQADLLGDWREEIILTGYETDWSAANCKLMVFSTPEPTNYKVPCLMQDHLYRMGIVWQNSSYNQPPHLGYDLAAYVGVDGSTYSNSTTSHAPEATPAPDPTTGEETLKAAAEDKGTVSGTCYTAGADQGLTASTSGEYVKVRTNMNGESLTFTVNQGYIVEGITIVGYSNNSSTTADRSISMTAVNIDGSTTSVLTAPVVFPGGTAGQNPVTCDLNDLNATQQIVLHFDNSNITTSDVDANGKNKQLMVKVTFRYRVASTGLTETETVVLHDSRIYDLLGRPVREPQAGHIYIQGGRKVLY